MKPDDDDKRDSARATIIFVLVLLGFLLAMGWATLSCVERTRDAWRFLGEAADSNDGGAEAPALAVAASTTPTGKEVFNAVMLGIAMARTDAPDAGEPEDGPKDEDEHVPSSDDMVETPPTREDFCKRINELRSSPNPDPEDVEVFMSALEGRGYAPHEVCTSVSDLAVIRQRAYIAEARGWADRADNLEPSEYEMHLVDQSLERAGVGYEAIGRSRSWADGRRRLIHLNTAKEYADRCFGDPGSYWPYCDMMNRRLSLAGAGLNDIGRTDTEYRMAALIAIRARYTSCLEEPNIHVLFFIDDTLREIGGTYADIPATAEQMTELRARAEAAQD